MKINYTRNIFIIMLAISIFTSCKKNVDTPATPTPTPTPTPVATAADKIKDTTLLYARDIYLWYNQIPANFDARSFADPDAIMKAIRAYSIEPNFPTPVDRFSFAMKQVDWNNLSSGSSSDFGLGVFFFNSPNITTDLRVKSVERESPAGKAGVKRGWQIVKINGSSNIDASNQTSLNTVVDAVFNSNSTSFTFKKPDGTTVDITLNAAAYQTHPVVLDSVYTINNNKIGYLVFSSFLGDQTEINNEFNRVFNRFATYGVNDVIVDLRYNGGGYVSLAEKLSDYLSPSAANGNTMMIQKYNDKYAAQYNVTTKFNKLGSLNLSRVFFIVSHSTASASELVINSLNPFMDVKLVGDTTYGKPVGFFPIPVGDWYIFPVSFKTVNSAGRSDYYYGFKPDAKIPDGLDKNWGDISESRLASAIKYITTGGFRTSGSETYRELPEITKGNAVLDANSFKGSIGIRKILK